MIYIIVLQAVRSIICYCIQPLKDILYFAPVKVLLKAIYIDVSSEHFYMFDMQSVPLGFVL